MTAIFKQARPYGADQLQLPVANVDAALPFYETVMGFRVVALHETPHRAALMERDGLQIGLAENGGDPTQDGCFFEVDDAEAAFAELKARGWNRTRLGFVLIAMGPTRIKSFSSWPQMVSVTVWANGKHKGCGLVRATMAITGGAAAIAYATEADDPIEAPKRLQLFWEWWLHEALVQRMGADPHLTVAAPLGVRADGALP